MNEVKNISYQNLRRELKAYLEELYYSVWAAITEYYRLGGLKYKHLFLSFRGWKVQGQGAGQFGFWWGVCSWLTDGCLSTMSSHGQERDLLSLLCLIKAPDLSDSDSTLMTSFNLYYLLTWPISTYSHLGILALVYAFWECENIQSTIGMFTALYSILLKNYVLKRHYKTIQRQYKSIVHLPKFNKLRHNKINQKKTDGEK